MATLDLSLHKAQLKVFLHPARVKTLVCGRRFGKTRLAIYSSLDAALRFDGTPDPVSPETVVMALPTLTMARGIMWQPLVSLCEETAIANAVKKIDRTAHRIDFYGKPSIYVTGANDRNGDGLRGKRIYYFSGDEYQDFKPGIWSEVVRPAMADTRGSKALITGTPKGRLNILYEMFCQAQKDPREYASWNLPTAANPFIPRREILRAKASLPQRSFMQEFFASFLDFPGKIYSELSKASNGSLVTLPGSFDLVVMGVDWGDVNPAIAVWGLYQGCWYFIEGWQGNRGNKQPNPIAQPVIDSHLVRLAAKWGVQYTYCDPSRPSSILGVRSLGDEYRLPGLQNALAGFNRIEEGLEQVHAAIYQKRIQFVLSGAHCDVRDSEVVSPQDAFKLFESYRRATDKAGNVTQKIEEGQDDHIVDSSRYALAVPDGLPGDYRNG